MDHSPLTPLDDSFEQLDPQRQEAVVRASVEAFGRHAYKDASTDDIARAAGMSKGLLFFYCKNKKQLYLRTMDYLYDKIVELVVDDRFWEIDDFFELMEYCATQKVERDQPFSLDAGILHQGLLSRASGRKGPAEQLDPKAHRSHDQPLLRERELGQVPR